jgi:hypothetical protein
MNWQIRKQEEGSSNFMGTFCYLFDILYILDLNKIN